MQQGYASSNNHTVYYYITNLQGDVIRLVDVNGSTAAYYEYDPYGNAIQAAGSHCNINPLRYRGYVYDTESGLYYLQSRYYDPKLGRFLNADTFVSTGQGILGNNMFAYCNNNPVMFQDDYGNFPMLFGEDYPGYAGRKIGEWMRDVWETDKDETDENGRLTTSAQMKRIAGLAWRSLDCSFGVGLGFEFENTYADMVGFGIGMHADVICAKLRNGTFSYGQEYSSGISASAMLHNVGFVESAYNEGFQPGAMETSLGFYGDESITLVSGAFYVGLGGHFRIGFDTAYFFDELNHVLQ